MIDNKSNDKFRFVNQTNMIDGIPIDPVLRDEFDLTDNDERPQWEIEDWWGKPYIATDSWSDFEETYDEYFARSQEPIGFKPENREEWVERIQKDRTSWFESFPSGTRYTVRCLDGGAWDRSTNRGSFPTLEDALIRAKAVQSGMYY